MFWLPTKVELMCPNMCFALYNIFGVENDMRSNYIPHVAPKIEFCSGKQKIQAGKQLQIRQFKNN